VEALLHRGADANAVGSTLLNPLMAAVQTHAHGLVQRLLSHTARPTVPDKFGGMDDDG
jgi:hypothetical protein